MNGLYADQNIGEMFHDIVNDIKDELPEKISNVQDDIQAGLEDAGIKINWPIDEPLWDILLGVAVILLVIIIGVSIYSASKKRRRKKALSVGEYPNVKKREKYPESTQVDADELFRAIERNMSVQNGEPQLEDLPNGEEPQILEIGNEEPEPQFNEIEFGEVQEPTIAEPSQYEPIKMEKIEVITQASAKKYGPENFNVSRSGKVYTEEELRKLIRK